jgi:hypothetical protein
MSVASGWLEAMLTAFGGVLSRIAPAPSVVPGSGLGDESLSSG